MKSPSEKSINKMCVPKRQSRGFDAFDLFDLLSAVKEKSTKA